jgi:hypothetical protein
MLHGTILGLARRGVSCQRQDHPNRSKSYYYRLHILLLLLAYVGVKSGARNHDTLQLQLLALSQ